MGSLSPRHPALPIETEVDPLRVVISEDGELREHYNLIYSAEDVERIRLGYCCIQCGESQVGQPVCPFPVQCWLCGYEMDALQRQRFAQEFEGNIRLGPTTTTDEELAIAEEILRRKELADRGMTPTGIIVPRAF